MKLIFLRGKHSNYSAEVPDNWYDKLMNYNWYGGNQDNTIYAGGNLKGRRHNRIKNPRIFMHRLILGLERGNPLQCDHIDGNGLHNDLYHGTDSRYIGMSNLRIVTNQQNLMNQRKQENSTSSYLGVSWHKQSQTWQANIRHNGKRTYLGCFFAEEAAAIAYDIAALKRDFEHVCLNFPEKRHFHSMTLVD